MGIGINKTRGERTPQREEKEKSQKACQNWGWNYEVFKRVNKGGVKWKI